MHAILAGLILAQAASVPPPHRETTKQAWEYTDEERFAMRFDPVSMRERALVSARQRGRAAEIDAIEAGDVPNVVDGNRNPELFLPFELFNFLLRDGFSTHAGRRESTRKRLEPLGANAEFWNALERSSEAIIKSQNNEGELLARLNSAESEEKRQEIRQQLEVLDGGDGRAQCRYRYEAIQRVTQAIGRERLYRILYEGIAPGLSTRADDPGLYARFQYLNGGCR